VCGILAAVRQADQYVGREILSGQFRIVERIGSGGMGAVYKAQQPSMDRHVAVKILHSKFTNRKDLVSRFSREARAMSHLTHPNTAKVFLYGQLEDGSCYIVMEHLEGKNLGQLIRHEGPMEPTRAIGVLLQACAALQEAHDKGIVHRDLKPENIFLSNQGGISDYVKVLDFGLAKVTEREMRPGSMILTQEGMVFGTPEFMSPEQAQGKILDARSDIYSLAVILYELVTGKLPFDAKTPMDYVTLHVQATPIPLATRAPGRGFPPALQGVLDQAMSKRPEERYQTASDFAASLRNLLSASALQDLAQTLPAGTIPTTPHSPSSTDPIAYERTTPKLEGPAPEVGTSGAPRAPSTRPVSDVGAATTAPGPAPRTDNANAIDAAPRKTLLGISRGPGIALLVGLGVLIGVVAAVGVTVIVMR
jgi:serine/threonine protein kinase